MKETICQVLDLHLTFNILLERPWIHDMQFVPSTYHQCLKIQYMVQEVIILRDQNFAQYCNFLVPHNREDTSALTDDISWSTSTETSCSTSQNSIHSSTLTKGKEKVGCSSSSPPSPSSLKDSKQTHYEEMDRLMKEFDKKCKLQCKGVGEYLVSLFDPPLSPQSHGKPSSTTKLYHACFVKASGVPTSIVDGICKQSIDISPHLHGKGFDLTKNMGYIGDSPLGKGKDIVKPLVAQFRSNKSKIGVGYGRQDKVQTSSKTHPKHDDSSSSTLMWVPKQKGQLYPSNN